MEQVEAGRFSVDAQGRIWRHILRDQPAEPQRAECPAERGYPRVLWNDERCRSCQARKAVWRYFYGPVPEGAEIVHKNGVRGDNRPENLEASFATYRPPANFRMNAHQVEELRRAYHAGGITQVELAECYGISQSYVSAIMRGELRAAVGGPTSENNRDKLTPEDARAIRERYAAGDVTYADLAEQYPVTAGTIYYIVNGEGFADARGAGTESRGEPTDLSEALRLIAPSPQLARFDNLHS
jgi:DNA-binding transcriptional regulator YiaG